MILHYFYKVPLPKDIPFEMKKYLSRVKKCKNKEECLKKTYTIISQRFIGGPSWNNVFGYTSNDVHKIWFVKKDQHCTAMNYLMRIFLVKSGYFYESDILLKYTHLFLSPHQYLYIKIKRDTWIKVDPWAGTKGYPLGEYAHGFTWKGTKPLVSKWIV